MPLIFCPKDSFWGVIFGEAECVEVPLYRTIPEFPPQPPDCPLRDWRTLATIDELVGWLSGDRGIDIRRAVDLQIEAANRQLDGAATLSRRIRA